jgi:hypothetical protein
VIIAEREGMASIEIDAGNLDWARATNVVRPK